MIPPSLSISTVDSSFSKYQRLYRRNTKVISRCIYWSLIPTLNWRLDVKSTIFKCQNNPSHLHQRLIITSNYLSFLPTFSSGWGITKYFAESWHRLLPAWVDVRNLFDRVFGVRACPRTGNNDCVFFLLFGFCQFFGIFGVGNFTPMTSINWPQSNCIEMWFNFYNKFVAQSHTITSLRQCETNIWIYTCLWYELVALGNKGLLYAQLLWISIALWTTEQTLALSECYCLL